MSIHEPRINDPMVSVVYDQKIAQWARELEDRTRARDGLSLPDARKIVARRAGVSPGTLENMRRGRVKNLLGIVRDRIQALVIRELESEIRRLSHDLEMALRCASHPCEDEVLAARAALAAARKLIEEIG